MPQTGWIPIWGINIHNMKNLILFSLILIVACYKNDNKPTFHWGEVSAIKNGNIWEAEIYAVTNKPYSQGIDILIEKFNEKGFKREEIFLYKIPLKVGMFDLDSTDVRKVDTLVGSKYFTLQDDGDAGGDSYYLLLNDNISDFIDIRQIDGKEIKGNFQMSFVKDLRYGEADPTAPDTIVFLDGKFHTRLID